MSKRLDAIRGRLKVATPRPWADHRTTKSIQVTHESPAFMRGDFVIARYPTRTNRSLLIHEEWEANATLIVNAPCDLSYCLELIEQAEKLAHFVLDHTKHKMAECESCSNEARDFLKRLEEG